MRRLMLRDSPGRLRAIGAALVVALATSACGIKGPLVPAKKPDPAAEKDATKAPAAAKP
jgi:predicted small lipoprotein YifL